MNEKIGFIGLGIMGRPMAANILKAGYDLMAYNRTPEKAKSAEASQMRRVMPSINDEGTHLLFLFILTPFFSLLFFPEITDIQYN